MKRGMVCKAAMLGALLLTMMGTATRVGAAVLIDSFETQVPWSIYQGAYSSGGFSTTTGVTDGTYSFVVTGTAGPDYSSMMGTASSVGLTTLLSQAATVAVDVYTPPGSFGFFQQWSLAVNNSDTGFQSVDSYSYSQSPTIGSQSTLTWTIPAPIRATLASSANPTALVFLVGGGFSAGNETMYIDNLRVPALVPEPASLGFLAIGGMAALMRRRRRAN